MGTTVTNHNNIIYKMAKKGFDNSGILSNNMSGTYNNIRIDKNGKIWIVKERPKRGK